MPNDEFEGIEIPIVEIPDGLEDTIFNRAFTETPTLSDDLVPDLYSEAETADDSIDDVALDIDALDDEVESDDPLALDDTDMGHDSGDSLGDDGDDFSLSGEDAASGIDSTGIADATGANGSIDSVDPIDSADLTDPTDPTNGGDDLFGGF